MTNSKTTKRTISYARRKGAITCPACGKKGLARMWGSGAVEILHSEVEGSTLHFGGLGARVVEQQQACYFTPYSIHTRPNFSRRTKTEQKKRKAFLAEKRLQPSVEVRVTLKNTRQDSVTFTLGDRVTTVEAGGSAVVTVDDVPALAALGKNLVRADSGTLTARLKKAPGLTVEAVKRSNGTVRKYVVGTVVVAAPGSPFRAPGR